SYSYNASLGTMLVSISGPDVQVVGTAGIPLSVDAAAGVKSVTLDGASWQSPATGFTPLSTGDFTLTVIGTEPSTIVGGTYGIWAKVNVAIDNRSSADFTLRGTSLPGLNAASGR